MKERIHRLIEGLRREDGASALEYGLIAGLVSIGLVTVLTTTGQSLNNVFTTISNALASIGGGGGS